MSTATKSPKKATPKKPKQSPEHERRQKAVQKIREVISQNIADGLAKAVEANPVSVPVLADETQLPTMNVYRIFKGDTEPGLTTVVLIARRLGVSIDSLVNGAKKKTKAKA